MPDVVTFDPINLRIVEISTGGDNELDWIEIYSEWKVWVLGDPQRQGYPPAFRVVGGDPVSNVESLGSTFFLLHPWKFRPAEHNHRLIINGNIFTDPAGQSTVVPTLGNFQVVTETWVSTLVESSVARLDLLQLQDSVCIDTVSGSDTGTGTSTEPVLTIAKAFDVANANGLSTFTIRGTVTLDRAAPNWKFVGQSEINATVNVAGFNVAGAHFEECKISGTIVGRVSAHDCTINSVSGLDGVFRECGIVGPVTTAASAELVFKDCFSMVPGTGTPQFTFGANNSVNYRKWSGGLTLNSVTAGTTISVDLDPGRCVLAASCTGGTVLVRGLSQIVNNAAGTTVVDAGLVEAELVNKAAVAAALAAS